MNVVFPAQAACREGIVIRIFSCLMYCTALLRFMPEARQFELHRELYPGSGVFPSPGGVSTGRSRIVSGFFCEWRDLFQFRMTFGSELLV